ncbi:hypothetical protein MTBBW1_1890014 [Desulfamplus magnetovallimortis]|uniref:Uncharacterized protein n=1 Tax=Desulfamplus magnetovallimortis TaxID=1246637 RepID=A0A1W1HAZ7_9BACT|nr:hypothetical protein MTBBW1_1890014 [Desulfamplus magnetovallimortis]
MYNDHGRPICHNEALKSFRALKDGGHYDKIQNRHLISFSEVLVFV